MTPLVMQEPPWYFWLVFGLVHGALFGYFAGLFLKLQQKREEEQRRWNSFVANLDEPSDASRYLPLSPSMREAYERSRWQGMVRSHMLEQTRTLRTVLDRLRQIEDKLQHNGS